VFDVNYQQLGSNEPSLVKFHDQIGSGYTSNQIPFPCCWGTALWETAVWETTLFDSSGFESVGS
jgi:hypothetical protein